jgi:hypothetical protein
MTPEQIYDFAKVIRKEERERIIALINSCEVGGYPDAEFIIALIKGEN